MAETVNNGINDLAESLFNTYNRQIGLSLQTIGDLHRVAEIIPYKKVFMTPGYITDLYKKIASFSSATKFIFSDNDGYNIACSAAAIYDPNLEEQVEKFCLDSSEYNLIDAEFKEVQQMVNEQNRFKFTVVNGDSTHSVEEFLTIVKKYKQFLESLYTITFDKNVQEKLKEKILDYLNKSNPLEVASKIVEQEVNPKTPTRYNYRPKSFYKDSTGDTPSVDS